MNIEPRHHLDLFDVPKLWCIVVMIVSISTWLFHGIYWQDYLINNHSEYMRPFDLRYSTSALFSLVFGFGFGTTLVLLWVVRHRYQKIFLPSQAKTILAFVFYYLISSCGFSWHSYPAKCGVICRWIE